MYRSVPSRPIDNFWVALLIHCAKNTFWFGWPLPLRSGWPRYPKKCRERIILFGPYFGDLGDSIMNVDNVRNRFSLSELESQSRNCLLVSLSNLVVLTNLLSSLITQLRMRLPNNMGGGISLVHAADLPRSYHARLPSEVVYFSASTDFPN